MKKGNLYFQQNPGKVSFWLIQQPLTLLKLDSYSHVHFKDFDYCLGTPILRNISEWLLVVYYVANQHTFWPQPSKDFPKKRFLYFLKKAFLIFRKGIFRTLAYLQLKAYSDHKAYSEHCRTSAMKSFAKIATQRTSLKKNLLYFFLKNNALKKILIFPTIELPSLELKKLLIFSEMEMETETLKNAFYFRKQNFLILQETETFPARI